MSVIDEILPESAGAAALSLLEDPGEVVHVGVTDPLSQLGYAQIRRPQEIAGYLNPPGDQIIDGRAVKIGPEPPAEDGLGAARLFGQLPQCEIPVITAVQSEPDLLVYRRHSVPGIVDFPVQTGQPRPELILQDIEAGTGIVIELLMEPLQQGLKELRPPCVDEAARRDIAILKGGIHSLAGDMKPRMVPERPVMTVAVRASGGQDYPFIFRRGNPLPGEDELNGIVEIETEIVPVPPGPYIPTRLHSFVQAHPGDMDRRMLLPLPPDMVGEGTALRPEGIRVKFIKVHSQDSTSLKGDCPFSAPRITAMMTQKGEETMSESIRVATVQFQHLPGRKKENMEIMEDICARAAARGVKIICFPEMCITGYWHVRNLSFDETEALSESVPGGPSVGRLEELSRRYGMVIGAGLIERADDGKLYNSYVVTQPDRPVRRHRKLHCFISPHMDNGDEYTVIETSSGIRLGVLICWDNNLTENARLTALGGADILMAPHQTGGCASRSPRYLGRIDTRIWENRDADPEALRREFRGTKGRGWLLRWLPSRAHDNGFFLMFSNGVGRDDDEIRTGNAMLIDCHGEIVAESDALGNDMVVGDFDMGELDNALGRNWIRGRRPELYGPLTEFTGREIDNRSLKKEE